MKTWFASRDAAFLLSFVALLRLLARSYADTDLILPEFTGLFGSGVSVVWIVGWLVIAGGWIWALVLAAGGGGRGVWIVLFGYALLTGLGFGLASLLAFPNFAMTSVFWISLIAGLLASVAVAFQLRSATAL